jgi:hypothetical protein
LDSFSAPAPAGPYAAPLSVFNGLSANGTWSLYAVDDGPGDQGNLATGWSLTLTTAAATTGASSIFAIPRTVSTAPKIAITLGDARLLTIVISGEAGRLYSLQSSSNLVDWTTVGVWEKSAGNIVVSNVVAGGTNCFYRAVSIPKSP